MSTNVNDTIESRDSSIQSSAESCRKAIRIAGGVALFSAAVTAYVGSMGNSAVYVDAVLIVSLAIFVLRSSRIASTLLFVYYLVDSFLMISTIGALGILLRIVILTCYAKAMRSTFLWHARHKSGAHSAGTELTE